MFFWFKRPKIILDTFCAGQDLADLFPLEPADQFLPNWFKDLPNTADVKIKGQEAEISTMKYCPGIRNIYEHSFVLRNWTEYNLTVDDRGNLDIDSPGQAESHPPVQYGSGFPKMINCKLHSPWVFREKTGVMFTWMGAEYNHPGAQYKIMNGMIDYRYQHGTNVNIMLPMPEKLPEQLSALKFTIPSKYRYTFKAGVPLVLIAPMSEKKVEVKTHVVTPEEFNRMGKHPHSRIGAYYNTRKFLRDKDEREAARKKCPFGFR